MNRSDIDYIIEKLDSYKPDNIYDGCNSVREKQDQRVSEVLDSLKAEFENGGYGLRPFGKGKLIPIMGHGNFNENEVEVIGNVYDNQELLEGDKT